MTFDEVAAYLRSLSSQSRSEITKSFLNPIKHPPKSDEVKSIIKFLTSFLPEVDISEKLYLLVNGLRLPVTCPICGKSAQFNKSTYKYNKYCSIECRNEQRKIAPNCAKQFLIEGVIYTRIQEATEALGISRHILLSRCNSSQYPEYRYYPDHEKSINELKISLSKKSPFLINREFLYEWKKARKSITLLASQLNVDGDDIRIAMQLFDIDTTHQQIDPSISMILNDKDQVQALIDEFGNTEKLSQYLKCSPSLIQQKLHDHEIKWVPVSTGEIEIAEYIRSIIQDVQIISQDRSLIAPKEIDIYLPEYKIGFEFNGVYWHGNERNAHKADKIHQEKYQLAKRKGIRLIQIFEDDWVNKQDLIKRKIRHILGFQDQNKIFARKCQFILPEVSLIRQFYSDNHIYGFKSCDYHVGLEYEGKLVAMMSFRKNKLERYATSCSVVGGFTKLLKKAINDNKYSSIETFADLCWSDEDDCVYVKNGFKKISITQPNYYWVVNGKKERREKYMKGNLKKMDNYSIDKSESQIMQEKGYWKIYDAGHAMFLLIIT